MLYITSNNVYLGDLTDTWALGKPVRAIRALKNVTEVRARGAELEYLRKYFTSLPDIAGAKEVVYRNNWAEFITSNLGWEKGK